MRKNEILRKLEAELEDGTSYTFMVLDFRNYPHKKGMFLAWE